MPSPSKRSGRQSRWSRLFDLPGKPGVVAGLWLVVAVVCAIAVATAPMSLWWPEQWTEPRSMPAMARGLAVVAVLGVFGLMELGRRRIVASSTSGESGGRSRASALQIVGVALGAAGMVVASGYWLTAHQHVPAGTLVLPLNEAAESVEAPQGDRTIDAMLPMRTTAHHLDLEREPPKVWIQFADPGAEIADPQPDRLPGLEPGESLDVENMRFAFTGLSERERRPRAFIASPHEETVGDAAMVGESVQLSVDGPSFRVVDVVADYYRAFLPALRMEATTGQLFGLAQGYPIGAMGPAVQLEDERGDRFWIFERHGELVDESDHVGESLYVEGIQMVPSPVFTVTPVRPLWPFGVGLALFVLGWAVFFGSSTSRRQAGDLDSRQSSSGWIQSGLGLVGLGALGAVLVFGAAPAGVAIFAGLAALLGLPMAMESQRDLTATVAAVAVPAAAVVTGLVVFGTPTWSPMPDAEPVLWTAMFASWLAMAATIIGAGVLSERSFEGRSTGGAVTASAGIWAAMGAVVLIGIQRGLPLGIELAVPAVAEEGEAVWAIPGVMAAEGFDLPVVLSASPVGWAAVTASVLAAVAAVGTVLRIRRVVLFGWVGALLSSVAGVLHLSGVGRGDESAAHVAPEVYENLASRGLEAMELPQWLAEMGAFQFGGALEFDRLAMIGEFAAFAFAASLSAAMIAGRLIRRVYRRRKRGGDCEMRRRQAVRQLLVRASMFGAMGWLLGLLTSWERLGMAGILAPMEWLGLAVVFLSVALAVVVHRDNPSTLERWLFKFGPALLLAALVWVAAIGAVAGVAPGAAVSPF